MRCGGSAITAARRRAADESGFTLVELMSAMLVTILGVVALITTMDGSRELVTFSEAKEAAVHVGEQQLEQWQRLPYAEIALSTAPPACRETPCRVNDPGFYVTGGFYRWDQDLATGEQAVSHGTAGVRAPACSVAGAPVTNCETLLVDGTAGGIPAARSEVEIAAPGGGERLTIEVQRFVTWVDDDCARCPGDGCAACTAAGTDYKRITVAVRIIGPVEDASTPPGERTDRLGNGGPGRPMLLSTVVHDPESGS